MMTKSLPSWAALVLFTLCIFWPSSSMAQVDYTNRVAGASCDDIQYWYVVGVSSSYGGNGTEYSVPADDGGSARLVCDTWSSRGSKDGSNMTTPFMEYHRGATANRISYLPNAQLRHQTITGLPKGKYKIGMREPKL